jgi:hypothetical protein
VRRVRPRRSPPRSRRERIALRDKLASLPLARQLTVDRAGLGRAARSKRSETLAPRKGAVGLTAAGALTLASLGRGSRVAALAGGAATLAGAALERWAVFRAGVESARDPR